MAYDPVLEFRDKVLDMRKKQVAFQQDKSRENLLLASEAEQTVDDMVGYKIMTDKRIRGKYGADLA
jgi:hypothetical protein|tara:strand:- start:176 stop:373 length:198 start_codon:yes stop_codon:yes gene_type:complete